MCSRYGQPFHPPKSYLEFILMLLLPDLGEHLLTITFIFSVHVFFESIVASLQRWIEGVDGRLSWLGPALALGFLPSFLPHEVCQGHDRVHVGRGLTASTLR